MQGVPDSTRHAGELRYGKYVQGQPLAIYRAYFYDIVQTSTPVNSTVPYWQFQYPSIVVANPNKSTDIRDLNIAVNVQTTEYQPLSSVGTPMYNTIFMANGKQLLDSIVVSSRFDMGPRNPPSGYSIFKSPMKSELAYLLGKPYAVLYSPIHHAVNDTNNPIKFGYGVVELDNIPDQSSDIVDLVRQRQIMPAAIDSLFGSFVMTPTSYGSSSYARSMSVDSDDKDHLYFAFFETTKEIMSNNDINVSIREDMQTPTVVKTKYNATTHSNIFADGFQLDTMPQQVLFDYIESNGGMFD
jgi:hypothetical protein